MLTRAKDPVLRVATIAGFVLSVILAGLLAFRLAASEPRACAVCGEAIGTEAAYEEPEYGDVYHASHDKILRCDYCGRIVSDFASGGPGVWKLDGRHMCAACHHLAVVDHDEALRLASRARLDLGKLGLKLTPDFQLSLVDEVTLRRLHAQRPSADFVLEGLTQLTQFGDGREDLEIFVLSGLPRPRCEWVLAHELTHAWCYTHHLPVHAPRLEEGAPELVARKVMASRPGPAARRLVAHALENGTPVYGEGLRLAYRYEQAHGFGQLVRLLETQPDF